MSKQCTNRLHIELIAFIFHNFREKHSKFSNQTPEEKPLTFILSFYTDKTPCPHFRAIVLTFPSLVKGPTDRAFSSPSLLAPLLFAYSLHSSWRYNKEGCCVLHTSYSCFPLPDGVYKLGLCFAHLTFGNVMSHYYFRSCQLVQQELEALVTKGRGIN